MHGSAFKNGAECIANKIYHQCLHRVVTLAVGTGNPMIGVYLGGAVGSYHHFFQWLMYYYCGSRSVSFRASSQ
jgi:hypothetical protein